MLLKKVDQVNSKLTVILQSDFCLDNIAALKHFLNFKSSLTLLVLNN
jgi:hypothetical protein